MFDLHFLPDGWEDYLYWQGQDRKTLRRINAIIKDIQCGPFDGIGKPELLKGIWAFISSESNNYRNSRGTMIWMI